jgi:hypothetical protein
VMTAIRRCDKTFLHRHSSDSCRRIRSTFLRLMISPGHEALPSLGGTHSGKLQHDPLDRSRKPCLCFVGQQRGRSFIEPGDARPTAPRTDVEAQLRVFLPVSRDHGVPLCEGDPDALS